MCAVKAGFILYPIHTLHVRMPSPSVLEPRVSKAAQVSVACTEHISEQQGDINRPGDKNWPTIVFQEVSFLLYQTKSQTHTPCFLVATSNESMSTKLFLKLLLFCSFFVFGRCFFRPKHQSVAGWKTVPEAFDVPVSLQKGASPQILRKSAVSRSKIKDRWLPLAGNDWVGRLKSRAWEWLVDGMIMVGYVGCLPSGEEVSKSKETQICTLRRA